MITISPYWKRLFEADYSESKQYLQGMSAWKETLAKDIAGIVNLSEPESSDPSRSVSKESNSPVTEDGVRVRYIVIRDEPLQTYRAVLVWLAMGQISFSQEKAFEPYPNPTSPKALYALAHKLEIEDLKSIALAAFTHRLDADNCMAELFSQHSFLYSQIKDAALKAVVANWSAIRKPGRMSYIQEIVKAGDRDTEQLAEIVDELLSQLKS